MHSRASDIRSTAAAPIRIVLAAFLVFAGLCSASTAMAAEGDVTWGVRTGTTGQDVNRQNFNYDAVDPGATVTDSLVISNHDTEALELDVYAADGFTTTSGQLDLVTKDTASVALGAWVSAESSHVTIDAGTSTEVPFTVTVPADATPGDYVGGIVTSLSTPSEEQGISVDRRLGVRIHLRVSGVLTPALAIDDLHVSYSGTLNPFGSGDATVSYTVHNTGNVRLSAGQSVSLSGPFGLFPREVGGVDAVPELMPGETWTVTADVADVAPAFWLTASAELTPQVVTTSTGAADTGLTVESVLSSSGTWAVPWTLLALVILLAAAVVATVLLLRRRGRRQKVREENRVKDAVEQALRERDSPNEHSVVAEMAEQQQVAETTDRVHPLA
ncbi:WxL protein peptidoglycan domain-containing protein [Leifsonia sp. A12D58]|uniref:WxL protein peptidoglycan domain-containing protein n=1 Tax=Leifsonia sp. A12D58 TaxID=3397674 RepID=UPI0039E184C5